MRKFAIGVFKVKDDGEELLVGHTAIEISRYYFTENVKKRNKNISKINEMCKMKRIEKKRQLKTKHLLKTHLGSEDAVSEQYYCSKCSYIYKFPTCKVYVSEN